MIKKIKMPIRNDLHWGLAALAFLIGLFLIVPTTVTQAQSYATRRSDAEVYAELTKAPQKAVDRKNPLATDADAIPAGAKLFELHCAECHGNTAEGARKGPSLRAQQVQKASPGSIFWLLTNGVVRHGMPVWSKLPEPQRWQLVSYIKSLTPAPERH